MDPDGTVYFILTLILSIVLCLDMAAVIKNEDCTEARIGICPSLASGVILFLLNFGCFAYLALPHFSTTLQLVLVALFVFAGVFAPFCIGLAMAEQLVGLTKLLKPLILLLNWTVTLVITLPVLIIFKIFRLNTETEVTQEDVMELVEDASDDLIDDEQKEMIENIFEFGELTAGDVMTHRTEVFAVDEKESCANVIADLKEQGFSRVPVYSGTVDTITGVLFTKDLLGVIGDEEKLNAPVGSIAREPMFVPKSCPADDLLMQFKAKHRQLAVVVDEYGGTSGIVTMEDILEEIVGNIQDEYDNEEEEYTRIDDETLVFLASYDIEDALELLGCEVTEEVSDADYDTIGGMIINQLTRIPEQEENAAVDYMGVRFTVLEVADRRIIRVKAQRLEAEETEE